MVDLNHAVKIAQNTYWVGSVLKDDQFQCHVYLIENGTESILIDPGSRLSYEQTKQKIEEVIPLNHIKYIICHHQDPDITGCIDNLLNDIGSSDIYLITHWRAWALLKHFGWNVKLYEIEEHGWKLKASDTKLKFVFTPYLHFPGAFCTFDEKTGVLFSSDIFGGFTPKFELFAKSADDYFEKLKPFHQHYMPSSAILNHGLDEIEKYPIEMIAPQHGSIIKKELIKPIIEKMRSLECGIFKNFKYTKDIVKLSKINDALESVINIIASQERFFGVVDTIINNLNGFYKIDSIKAFLSDENNENILMLDSDSKNIKLIEDKQKTHILLDAAFLIEEGAFFYRPSKIHKLLNINEPSYTFAVKDKDGRQHGICFVIFNPTDINSHMDPEIISKFELPLTLSLLKEKQLFCLENKNRKLYEESLKDPLTGLYNRRYMELFMKREVEMAKRYKHTLSALMIDIDDFKKINDQYGHRVGDEVLKKIAKIILDSTRSVDVAIRFGGEEFVVILPNTNISDAKAIAGRIRENIENSSILECEDKSSTRCTVSIGVSSTDNSTSIEELINYADKNMYKAKRNGKNRVIA
ncbi:diguanylate cyclase [Hippea sp. KM1]|uniref:diguanylate cyclase n=1 Tax=Hippea sp. KM1 TaxID=944481 RepID=UPI00046CF99E|nr:diguanylate cyclase [Hippea sp. KM1]